MVDITKKQETLRIAKAQAIVQVGSLDTIKAIIENKVPKGNVFEMAKAAGLLGVKKTPELLPDCHPIPIEFTGIEYKIEDLSIIIEVTVKTIYKTGVEVEAMHGASVVALTMYDMLKPIDKKIEISTIKLLSKKGGKSDFSDSKNLKVNAKINICSDSISAGNALDKTGIEIRKFLQIFNLDSTIKIIPDDKNAIEQEIQTNNNSINNILIFSGGTGVSKRDNTPETIKPFLEKELKGIENQIFQYGQKRTPLAMLSRLLVGTLGRTLIISIPGSTKGAIEALESTFPHILHVFKVFDGKRHE